MISLRPITGEEFPQIKAWPSYRDEFERMDYALREGGWLDEYGNRADTWIYIAESDKQAAGFSLLSQTAEGEAEFRIAVHPHRTGRGFGREITIATLKRGFEDLYMDRIHLIVRKNNYPAMKVYERLGFLRTGESVHSIQGQAVDFFDMGIDGKTFRNLQMPETK